MKKILLLAFVFLLVFKTQAQIKVNSIGNVGVGVSVPAAKIHINGNGLFVSSTAAIVSAPYIRGGNNYSTILLPDYTWWNNDQTGFFHPTNDQIGVTLGGTQTALFSKQGILFQVTDANAKVVTIESQDNNQTSLFINDLKLNDYGYAQKIYVKKSTTKAFAVSNNAGVNDRAVIWGDGHAVFLSTTTTSDERVKKNIENIDGAFNKISKMKGHVYEYDKEFSDIKGKQYGFIAQELRSEFPQLVFEDDNGMLSVNYTAIIPVLVEAIKEQQIQLDALKYQLQNPDKTKRESEEDLLSNATHLDQNFPNPFDSETSVSYFIAPEANSASIMIFDMKGTLLRTYDKLEKGKGEIVIESGQLSPGMYMYSLIVNGVELDNKRMILTE